MIIRDYNGWQFRINPDVMEEMNKLRLKEVPIETGGVLLGWINSFEKIIYVGMAVPAPPDSVERPYYFQRGKKGLFDSGHSYGFSLPCFLVINSPTKAIPKIEIPTKLKYKM